MQIFSIFSRIFLCFVVFFLASCDYQVRWRDSPYQVLSIDNSGLSLSYDLGNDASIGRVDSEVVAIGSNDAFIVVEQLNGQDSFYFYVDRAKDGPYRDAKDVVVGPLTKVEFDKVKLKLNLPLFTHKFR